MRVLHILKSNSYSGAEHVVCTIIHNMSPDDECYYVSPDGSISQRLRNEQINHIVIEKMAVGEVRDVISKLQPDIVHAHDFTASVIVAYACKKFYLLAGKRPRVISHLHCNPEWIQRINIKTIAYRIASQWMDSILVVSDAVRDEYVFRDKLSCQMTTIGNPFSVREVLQSVDVQGKNVDNVRSDILYVGRLSQPKAPLRFLEIISTLGEHIDMTGMRVIMVGDGELRSQCEMYIEQKHLKELVTMVGFQENPYNYMANTKVLIMPSEWEGFGLVALEAMAFGIPVVCSGAGGLKTIVDESCGKVTDVTKPNQMIMQYVDELKMLLKNNAYYGKKSENARHRAEKFSNIQQYMARLYSLY